MKTNNTIIDEKVEESSFDEFQLDEYKNLSNCHYESVKQVSLFFRYYLLILAAPVFLLSLISESGKTLKTFLSGNNPSIYYDVVFIYFFLVSILGFFILWYIINLRHDAVLYAKAVNKVRRYFYETSNLKSDEYLKYLGLPITSSVPKYIEKSFFYPLITVFSFVNCGFLFAAFSLHLCKSPYIVEWSIIGNLPITYKFITIVIILYFFFHFLAYHILSNHRQNKYLKSYTIGIDIDGVLNDQTSNFFNELFCLTGKKIDINMVKEIPVHLNKGIEVTSEDELIVFNTKNYWNSLKVLPNASKRVDDLQKKFGLDIVFFTSRDWPQYPRNFKNRDFITNAIKKKEYESLNSKKDIEKITYDWLIKHEFISKSDKYSAIRFIKRTTSIFINTRRVVIEKGNPYISDTRLSNYIISSISNNNRFQKASKNGFRFFIEDNPENAIKLSGLCDYIFLFDQPYNKDENYNFPKNVIRVYSWDDIYKHLKTLC